MNITICSNTKGGVFTYTNNLVKGLARKGHNINVFFLIQSEESKDLKNSEHINYNYFITSRLIPNIGSIIKFIFKDCSDIIHINFAIFVPLALLKKFISKTPFIYTLHGIPEPWLINLFFKKLKYIIEYSLFRFTVSHASTTITISNYIKNKLKTKYNIESEVIYNYIDINRFKNTNKDISRRKTGYTETDFVVLYVGALSSIKDPITLVMAINKAVETKENIYLALVGKGELYNEIIYLINKLDISNNIKLTGYLTGEDLLLHYNAADLFVLPSVHEGFGIVLLEAMASGLPIIASNSGACPEVIGNVGILFRQGDYLDLAEKILELSDNEECINWLSNEGLKRVQIFSRESTINNYLKIYENIGKFR